MTTEYPTIGRARKMEARAARLGWNIPDIHKQAIVDAQVEIALDKAASPREKTSAAKCLVSMEGQNIAIAATASLATEDDRLEPVTQIELLAQMQKTIPTNDIEDPTDS